MDERVASAEEVLTDTPEIGPDLLAAAAAASCIGIHEYDLRSGALSWDDRVRALWGVGPAEPVTYETFLSGVHPEDRAGVERAVAIALDPSGSGQFESEYRVIPARGGPLRWVLATAQVSFESGRPTRLLGTVLDTTARRQGTARQRAEELRLDAVRETARDGLMVFRSVRDERGRIVDFVWLYANPAAGRITGNPSRWFAGRRLLVEMPGNHSAGLFDGYARVVESRNPWRHEFTYRLGGDTRLMRLVAAPVDDGFAVVFSDLTDRRQADEKIAERERRFHTLANSMPQLVFTNAPDGSPEFLSDQWAAFTGQPLENLVGNDVSTWARVMHSDDLEGTRAAWGEALATGRDYESEFRLRRHDGVYRWYLSRAVPQRGVDGRIERWIGTCTDIDDAKALERLLRQQEQSLREADRHKDVFLATLAHELRNPLGPIRNAARVLRTATDDPTRERASAIIDNQVRTMALLLDDLLDLSRISAGKLELKRRPVTLDTILEAAVEQVRPLVDRRGHSLTVDQPGGPVRLEGDELRLTQVIANLLTNAAKYTPDGGRIAVSVTVAGSQVLLAVRDSGVGLGAQAIARIFDLFVQEPGSLSGAEGGLGIGLALVKGLTELHGGHIAVASDGPGKGSTFTVTLPLGGDAPERGRRARGRGSVAADGGCPVGRGRYVLHLALPVRHLLLRLLARDPVRLLDPARELLPLAVDDVQVVVGEVAPALLDLALELLPVAFDAVVVHGSSPMVIGGQYPEP